MFLMPTQDPKPKFDPDFTPAHPTNVEAAKAAKVRYDPRTKVYRDPDGCIVRDRFGQKL